MIDWLTAKIVAYVTGGLAVLLAIGLGVQTLKLSAVRVDLANQVAITEAVKSNLKTCTLNTVGLEASLRTQGAAVAALKRESEARVAQSAKAAQAARSEAQKARTDVARILATRREGDACAAADRLIMENTQ